MTTTTDSPTRASDPIGQRIRFDGRDGTVVPKSERKHKPSGDGREWTHWHISTHVIEFDHVPDPRSTPPHGYGRLVRGHWAREVSKDPGEHVEFMEGVTWAPVERGDDSKVWEFAPVPEALKPKAASASTEPSKGQEPAEAARKPRKPRADKFAYSKALRGRVGPGRELEHREHTALMRMWDYADDDLTNARPGNTRLAEDLGYSGSDAVRSARSMLKTLERKRFLVLVHDSRGRGSANVYRLTLPEWEPPMP